MSIIEKIETYSMLPHAVSGLAGSMLHDDQRPSDENWTPHYNICDFMTLLLPYTIHEALFIITNGMKFVVLYRLRAWGSGVQVIHQSICQMLHSEFVDILWQF